MNMQIGHMAVPTTWTVTQNAKGSMLSEWWEVKNDVDGAVAFFRNEDAAKTYAALQEKAESLAAHLGV